MSHVQIKSLTSNKIREFLTNSPTSLNYFISPFLLIICLFGHISLDSSLYIYILFIWANFVILLSGLSLLLFVLCLCGNIFIWPFSFFLSGQLILFAVSFFSLLIYSFPLWFLFYFMSQYLLWADFSLFFLTFLFVLCLGFFSLIFLIWIRPN